MSVGPLGGMAGSFAGSSLAQTQSGEVERAQQESNSQQRRVQSDRKAEAAAGIGETDGEDHGTEDRDADGRRLWEEPSEGHAGEENGPRDDADSRRKSKDASGLSGNQLDLSG